MNERYDMGRAIHDTLNACMKDPTLARRIHVIQAIRAATNRDEWDRIVCAADYLNTIHVANRVINEVGMHIDPDDEANEHINYRGRNDG